MSGVEKRIQGAEEGTGGKHYRQILSVSNLDVTSCLPSDEFESLNSPPQVHKCEVPPIRLPDQASATGGLKGACETSFSILGFPDWRGPLDRRQCL
jgi:hypothetical protein